MLKQTEVLIRNSPLSERGFQSLQEEVSELVFEKPPVSVARPSLPGLPPPPPRGWWDWGTPWDATQLLIPAMLGVVVKAEMR